MNMKSLNGLLTVLLLGLTLFTSAQTAANDQGVVLINIIYQDGSWKHGGTTVLPCEAPSQIYKKLSEPKPGKVMFRVLGKNAKLLQSFGMTNPRVILVEDPTVLAPLLDTVQFNLRLPYSPEMESLHFWDDPAVAKEKAKEPALKIDLRPTLKTFQQKSTRKDKAPCDQPNYQPDARKKK